MPLELLQDSDSSSVTIGPHWPSSYPEYLSPHQDKDEQRRVVWARLLSQRSNLAGRLSETKARYLALHQELNPRTTQVESSHDLLYCDTAALVARLNQIQRLESGSESSSTSSPTPANVTFPTPSVPSYAQVAACTSTLGPRVRAIACGLAPSQQRTS